MNSLRSIKMSDIDLNSDAWTSTQILAWREKTSSQIAWASLVLTILAAIAICIYFIILHFFIFSFLIPLNLESTYSTIT